MNLKATENRVIVSVDHEAKNWHTFSNGTKIRRERQFNELNRRISEPVNAIVIDGEGIPPGTEIIIHPNGPTETNRIYNFHQLSGEETGSDIKHYSIPKEHCFIWKDSDGNWKPLKPYETALRVYEPYSGLLQGIEPKLIKNVLYVTSGELSGKVVKTLPACDYVCIFQDTNGQEAQVLRFRPFGDGDREEEAIAIMDELTECLNNGGLLVGLESSKAKPIHELICL